MRKRNFLNASMILFIGTVFSKVMGFFREVSVAYNFGANEISDAFLLTNTIPSTIFVSLGSVIGINFIPYCVNIKDSRKENELTSNVLNLIFVIMLLGCLIICVFPKIVLKVFGAGLPKATEEYAIVMLRIVIFSVIPLMCAHLFQAYLQMKGEFYSSAFYSIITNFILIFFTWISTEQTYWLLSVGTVLANLFGMLMVLYGAKRKGFLYQPILRPLDHDIKELVLLTIPLVAEDLASSMSTIVDRSLASYLDSGALSGLSYAGTISNIAGTMLATPIITAIYPSLSIWASDDNKEKFESEVSKCLDVLCLLLIPIVIFMIFFAPEIVTVIFEHGAFEGTATKVVSQSLICYLIGVIPMAMQTYLIRLFYSYKNTRTPVKVKVFSLICNMILNLLLVRVWTYQGIALATSISFFISYIILLYILVHNYNLKKLKRNNSYCILYSILSGCIGGLVLWISKTLLYDTGALLKCFILGTIYLAIYIIIMVFVKKEYVFFIIDGLKKREKQYETNKKSVTKNQNKE